MKKSRIKKQRVKRYSVIVIPDSRARVWRREISRKQVEAFFAVSLAIAVVMCGSIWGFAHYRSSYIATADVRLQNAKFEQERSELLTKLANLEQVVERTERFANRLESSYGVNSDEIQKGIGPLMESEFSEPVSVKQFENLNVGSLNSKLAFADLDMTMEGLESSITTIEERLHTVYDLQQDRLTYWASMPSVWPARGWVTSDFGPRRRPIRGGTSFHKGIDIAAPPGAPIVCPGDGVVTFSGYRSGMGRTVVIDHGYGVVSVFGHNSKNFVNEGDHVKRGELVGTVGRTGLATGSHLHYQVEVDGVPVDPMRYIKRM